MIIGLFGYGGWFWGVNAMWVKFNSAYCLTGFNILNFINVIVLLVSTFPIGIILALMTICCPCLCCTFRAMLNENPGILDGDFEGNSAAADEGTMQALIRRQFTASKFKSQTECIICMSEYTNDDEVTPLPCNESHYFHTACLEQWMQTKSECPLCRAPIDQAALNAQHDRLLQADPESEEEA